jgi:long-subunit acyl-CoA synthetase (AMP-forming)
MKLRQPYDSLAKDGGRLGHESEVPEVLAYVCYRKTGQHLLAVSLQLKKHGIHQLIVVGLIAHTCIEATVRFAAELGYEVTVVKTQRRITRMRKCTALSTSYPELRHCDHKGSRRLDLFTVSL